MKRKRPNLRKRRRARLESLESRRLLAADGLQLAADTIELDQNAGPTILDVLANDSFDEDYSGPREITAVSTGSLGGRIERFEGMLRYSPPAGANGTERFHYTVDDLQSAEVAVQITSPLVRMEVATDHLEEELRFDVIDEAYFPEGYAGSKRITLVGESGLSSDIRISDDARSIIYRPAAHRSGYDSFVYIVDEVYVSEIVVHVKDPLARDKFEVLQNSDVTNLDVLANDFVESTEASPYVGINSESAWAATKAAARITHVLDADPSEVAIAADGKSLLYQPPADDFGYRSFRYVVDGRFEQSVSVMVQRPVVNDRLDADIDGGSHALSVLANDEYYSIDASARRRVVERVTSVTKGEHGGIVEVEDGGQRVVYTPPPGFVGTESFEYIADDKYRATVTVHVTDPVRDDVASAILGGTTRVAVLANDFVGGNRPELQITSVGTPTSGATVTISHDGAILYTPMEGTEFGYRDTFDYTVNEEYSATVTLYVTSPVKDDRFEIDRSESQFLQPLANDQFAAEYDGTGKITSLSEPSRGGVATINIGGRTVTYVPGAPDEHFTYTVDDQFTGTIRITSINRLRSDNAVAEQNGDEVEVNVLENDFGDWLNDRYGPYLGPQIVSVEGRSEQGGLVRVNSFNRVVYTPPQDFAGVDTFRYLVDDFLTETVTVRVIRRVLDDVVRVVPDSVDNELRVLFNDVLGADHTGPGLISDIGSSAIGASVELSHDRRAILYTPPIGYRGTDELVYTLDGQYKATVTVQVHAETRDILQQPDSLEDVREELISMAVKQNEDLFGTKAHSGSVHFIGGDGGALDLRVGSDLVANNVSHSETNVQVAGIDEHDIVETDGSFIYTLRGNELIIVKSLPVGEMEVVSRTLVEGRPVGMYLHEDRVAVISEASLATGIPANRYAASGNSFAVDFPGSVLPYPIASNTILTLLDVADRSSPTIVQRTEFSSRFVDSRRIDNQVYLVFDSPFQMPHVQSSCDENSECFYETKAEYIERVRDGFVQWYADRLPEYASYGGDGEFVRGGPVLLPQEIFLSGEAITSVTVVAAFDMSQDAPGLTAVAGVGSIAGSKIYASESGLYIFEDRVSSDGLQQTTGVRKFSWGRGLEGLEFSAAGELPGRILNQFSVDELDGKLRVTSEVRNAHLGNFSGESETGVYILEEDGGVLEFVGSLQNLSIGSHVKSVRYFGDRVFVTTFSRVDPLYAIDLSDPREPLAVGHVPIAGFSSYMQFIAPNRLLAIGLNSANGSSGRAMVSLFDVEDLTAPRLVDSYNLPQYSRSEANQDHHAFGWFTDHELLSVPTSRNFVVRVDEDGDGYAETDRYVREDELSILHVGTDLADVEGISLRGNVSHQAAVRRSVAIDNHVYSVGADGVRAVHVADGDHVVDEVLFDFDVVDNDPPAVPFDHGDMVVAARKLLESLHSLNPDQLVFVTREQVEAGQSLIMRHGLRHYLLEGTEPSNLEIIDVAFALAGRSQHNVARPLDANGDGRVSASDALLVINELAREIGSPIAGGEVVRAVDRTSDRYADTNGDGRISALDALRIINEITRVAHSSASSEYLAVPSVNRLDEIDEFFRDSGEVPQLF